MCCYGAGNYDEEVKLEMRSSAPVPDTKSKFCVNFVWKSTSFDRMQNAMKMFAVSSKYSNHFIVRYPVFY